MVRLLLLVAVLGACGNAESTCTDAERRRATALDGHGALIRGAIAAATLRHEQMDEGPERDAEWERREGLVRALAFTQAAEEALESRDERAIAEALDAIPDAAIESVAYEELGRAQVDVQRLCGMP